MKLVCISDTHGLHQLSQPPDGDLLIHAGDMTMRGRLEEVEVFNAWLGTLPHRHKVVIAGNHDFCFQKTPEVARERLTNAHYLEDEALSIDGLTLYGSPWQPWFHNWAFNLQRGAPIKEKWDLIPDGVDVLITHGPPFGIADTIVSGRSVGCEELLIAVEPIRPRFHIFGHIHEGWGVIERPHTTFINASFLDWELDIGNDPIVVEATHEDGGMSGRVISAAPRSQGKPQGGVLSGLRKVVKYWKLWRSAGKIPSSRGDA